MTDFQFAVQALFFVLAISALVLAFVKLFDGWHAGDCVCDCGHTQARGAIMADWFEHARLRAHLTRICTRCQGRRERCGLQIWI